MASLNTASFSLSSKPLLQSSFSATLPNNLRFSRSQSRTHRRFLIITATSSSSNNKPTVLVAEKLGEAGLTLLEEFADVDCSYNLSPEELRSKVSLCDALIVRSGTEVDRDVFDVE